MNLLRQGPNSSVRGESEEPAAAGGRSRAGELISGLEEIFVREGFRRLTIGELATRLHCSRRSLYELAPGKNQLFVLVLDRVLRRIDDAGRAAASETLPFEERVTAFIEPGIVELRGASAAFFADIAGLPAARDRLASHQEGRKVQLEKLLAAGMRAKAFRKLHPGVAARAMVAAYRAVTDANFLVSMDVTLPEAVREVQNIFVQGLLPSKAE